MIPQRNKDIFIDCIAQGGTFEQACAMSHISRDSMFRFLRNDPIFKKKYDDALFEVKEKKRLSDKDKGMADIKKIIMGRK